MRITNISMKYKKTRAVESKSIRVKFRINFLDK